MACLSSIVIYISDLCGVVAIWSGIFFVTSEIIATQWQICYSSHLESSIVAIEIDIVVIWSGIFIVVNDVVVALLTSISSGVGIVVVISGIVVIWSKDHCPRKWRSGRLELHIGHLILDIIRRGELCNIVVIWSGVVVICSAIVVTFAT